MVEFDSLESATRAKEALHNADIYSGCCTLKIDYAKPEKLNVHKNDPENWDYTVSSSQDPKDSPNGGRNGRPQPLLQEPHFGGRPQPYHSGTNNYSQERFDEGFGYENYNEFGRSALMKEPPQNGARGFGPSGPGGPSGSVMMVYGLDGKKHNTDSVFNLLCLYGNVARVKFLKSKEGTAMVQMGDAVAVERCIMHLNNVQIGENKLQVAFSKQAFLSEVTNPFQLHDKTPSFKEYTANKNNRFMSLAQASKNRIQPPSKILHFFNVPPRVTDDIISGVFETHEVTRPVSVKLFPSKSERSSSGLLEFSSVSEAVQAIMACNHAAIETEGTKFPFTMKLCFSSSRNISSGWLDDLNSSNNSQH